MDATMTLHLRKVMKAFIDADGYPIVLNRPNMHRTGTGGYVKNGFTALPPQTFRLVMYRRRLTDLTTPTADGEVPTIPYVLVGYHDANIQRYDEFHLNGAYYRVQGLEPHTADRNHNDRIVAQLITLDQEGVTWT